MQDHHRCYGDDPQKEGRYSLHESGFGASISVALLEADARVWHQILKHMREKGMKVMLSKDKLLGLKSVDLDLCETASTGSRSESVSQ